jgi:hypothetical protein
VTIDTRPTHCANGHLDIPLVGRPEWLLRQLPDAPKEVPAVRHLVTMFVSTRCRRSPRREPLAYLGSFGDDCFDDEPVPRRRPAFCRRATTPTSGR